MAYYRPLQKKDGKWDYVCTNGAGTFPLGYCAGYNELKDEGAIKGMFPQESLDRENARTAPFKEKYHTCGHDTAAEAMICHREYLLDQHLTFDGGRDATTQHKCGVCGEWTTGTAVVNNEGWTKEYRLCVAHHNRESVEAAWPKD